MSNEKKEVSLLLIYPIFTYFSLTCLGEYDGAEFVCELSSEYGFPVQRSAVTVTDDQASDCRQNAFLVEKTTSGAAHVYGSLVRNLGLLTGLGVITFSNQL